MAEIDVHCIIISEIESPSYVNVSNPPYISKSKFHVSTSISTVEPRLSEHTLISTVEPRLSEHHCPQEFIKYG